VSPATGHADADERQLVGTLDRRPVQRRHFARRIDTAFSNFIIAVAYDF